MTKRLYVGNLSYSVTVSTLEELFSSIGEVTSVDIITDRMTGRSRGFAFVEMAGIEDAQKAIAELDGRDLGGRAIKVSEAHPRRERSDSGGYGDQRGGRRDRY
jgi:RNA recognition motif-containing protein